MDICEADFNALESNSRHPWERARAIFIKSLLKKHIGESGNTVIDIGCGDCFLLNRLATTFPHISFIGIDTAISPEKKEQILPLLQTGNISIYNKLDASIPVNKSCSVSLLDVLEHVSDDRQLLEELTSRESIDDTSMFIITVPAFNSLFSEHDIKLNHYRRYNLKDLEKITANAGLEKLESGYFFFSLLLFRILQKYIFHSSGRNQISWKKSNRSLTSISLTSILLLDICICRFFATKLKLKIPGLSCYTICRKQP